MKKIVFTVLFSLYSLVHAQQQVPSIWAFNITNVQGSYFRATLDEANRIQTKYKFGVEHRPGAGGEVAAAAVNEKKNPVLLGTAAAFFVRPYLYKTNYTFDQFKPIHVMAQSPAALVSKNKSLQEILSQNKITIGTAGPGSMIELMALKFKDYYPNKDIVLVPYKSSPEAMVDVLGGHIDLTYEYLGDGETKGGRILGLTGRTKIKNYPLLKDMGYPNQADLGGTYLILVKSDMPIEQYKEIQEILLMAEKSPKVQELYMADYSTKPLKLRTYSDYMNWYDQTIKSFKVLTTTQTVE